MYVAAIDQGTTGTRAMVFDREGRVKGEAYGTHEQYYPEPGWVEHDPDELLERSREGLTAAIADAGVAAADIAAIGVTNQRETTVLWAADTGDPVDRAVVWQDRRTTDRIAEIERADEPERIRETTGLEPDAYFSATKLEWLLDEHDPERDRASAGELLFGTVDTWLIWNLTGAHVTDVTNASRTMLFDIHELSWDEELLAAFDVPRNCLPAVRPSSDAGGYGVTDADGFLGAEVPITAALGDQQAALFGQCCFDPGEAKNTYGTGAFLLCNTGAEAVESDGRLLTTVGFQRSGEPVRYALEGAIFVTGAAIEWLEDVSLVDDAAETERLARSTDGTEGVYVVPAFSGLGAPFWDGRARGTIVGLTRSSRREHLVRATLEAIGYRTRDVVDAMEDVAGVDVGRLRVDGGAVANDFLCEFQAAVLDATVLRPTVEETTALGAAYAAGLAVDYWGDLDELRENARIDRRFEPTGVREADRKYERWRDAVDRARGWAPD